jgi:hypothetical protein
MVTVAASAGIARIFHVETMETGVGPGLRRDDVLIGLSFSHPTPCPITIASAGLKGRPRTFARRGNGDGQGTSVRAKSKSGACADTGVDGRLRGQDESGVAPSEG